MHWIVITLGLIIGNFLVQAVWKHDWLSALERSTFQVVAICLIYVMKPWEK